MKTFLLFRERFNDHEPDLLNRIFSYCTAGKSPKTIMCFCLHRTGMSKTKEKRGRDTESRNKIVLESLAQFWCEGAAENQAQPKKKENNKTNQKRCLSCRNDEEHVVRQKGSNVLMRAGKHSRQETLHR